MSERLILPLSGNPNSGKSTVAKHLAEKFGFSVCRPSNLIRAHAAEKGLPLVERADYISAHIDMIKEHGEDYVTRTILEIPSQRVCVDGERVPKHIEELQKHGAKVVALWCPIEIRFYRALERGELRDKPYFSAFAQDEAQEYQNNTEPFASVMTVMQMADHHIDASQPTDKLLAAVDAYVEPMLPVF